MNPYGEMYGTYPPSENSNNFQQMIQQQQIANRGYPSYPPHPQQQHPPPHHILHHQIQHPPRHQMYYAPPPPQYHPYPQQQQHPYYPPYQYQQQYYAPPQAPQQVFECKTCDKSYPSSKQLQAHILSHQKCPHCDHFSAMGRVLKEHIRDEHGISPEPKLPSSLRQLIPKKYLHVHKQDFSEESVKKWIAERKRKYPTKENVEKKREVAVSDQDDKNSTESTKRKRRNKSPKLCKYFLKGTCKQGKKCKFEHDESFKVIREEKLKRRKLDRNKGLLKALLQKDIGREHEILLQAVRFLVRETDLLQ